MSVDQKKLKYFKRSIESLLIKYDMFFSNKQYKNVHFKSEKEYETIQKNLSSEIEMEETNAKNFLKEWIEQNFKNIKFIAYDSRFICINKLNHRIGRILLKNVKDENEKNLIKQRFNEETEFDVIIDLFEELTEDVKLKFTKLI